MWQSERSAKILQVGVLLALVDETVLMWLSFRRISSLMGVPHMSVHLRSKPEQSSVSHLTLLNGLGR